VADLTDILLSVVDESIDRQDLTAKGQLRAKEFSWDKTVSQTLDVYNSIVT